MDNLFQYLVDRDPNKRKVKPAAALFEFADLEGESSDDSDFRIEDHADESDDSIDSNIETSSVVGNNESDSDDASEDEVIGEKRADYSNILSVKQKHSSEFNSKNALKVMICTVCLGERSDSSNEIIECDNCGVTVHEGCYGVQDSDSVCSTDSPCPTTPWFCDACKAGLEEPVCELCPNSGGIFKETDVGKWVHLVCALYVPGVAFAEVDRLHNVTLFEMPYTRWGAKPCFLCQDQRYARSGVLIGCDAGLCKTHFHVTCGQREGLLVEAHNTEDVEQADPFYAHCKLHTDKTLLRKRRRNWLALQMRSDELKKLKREDEEAQRIQRRLAKYRTKYLNSRQLKLQPWVPTQKMARLLSSSASACRALWRKAELSGADTEGLALRRAQEDALADVHKRWHIQPAFTVEFIGYYLERNNRVTTMRKQLSELLDENSKLLKSQSIIEESRDKAVKDNTDEINRNQDLKKSISVYHDLIKTLCPDKTLPVLDHLGRNILQPIPYSQIFPTRKQPQKEPVSLNNSCGLCNGKHDQHLLAKCDTCLKYYHLACLSPPLTRMPKKTKQMGWQCSECDNESGDEMGTSAPRKRKVGADSFSDYEIDETPLNGITPPEQEGMRAGKKRKREKHNRYSPEPGFKPHKHRHKSHKQKDEQRQSIKICFKSIPSSGGSYVATNVLTPPTEPIVFNKPLPKKKEDEITICDTCKTGGTQANLVTCDECLKGFHFTCLDPPVKKSPKVRGYSWHCANCDPTESDDDDDD